jgi:hypothetical protein
MDYADSEQWNGVFTQTLRMLCNALVLIFSGLSLGGLVMCLGLLAWQSLTDALAVLRRGRSPRHSDFHATARVAVGHAQPTLTRK